MSSNNFLLATNANPKVLLIIEKLLLDKLICINVPKGLLILAASKNLMF